MLNSPSGDFTGILAFLFLQSNENEIVVSVFRFKRSFLCGLFIKETDRTGYARACSQGRLRRSCHRKYRKTADLKLNVLSAHVNLLALDRFYANVIFTDICCVRSSVN